MRARVLTLLTVCLLGTGLASAARAVGVAAGTTIENQATVTYELGGAPLTARSPVNVVTVEEVIDVTVTLLSVPVSVNPGDTGRVLAFRVTNTGNGVEGFTLAADSALAGDDFDPVFTAMHVDDGDGSFDPLLDALYVPGTNDPLLDANSGSADSALIFVLNDIPGSALDGQTGSSQLTATSTTSGARPPGTVIPGGGDGATIDAIVGSSGASDAAQGTYIVRALTVQLIKSASVLPHPIWGTQPIAGATIQYTIRVQVSGVGTADNLVITDPVPANAIYEADSISLDDGSTTTNLSDAADADAGDYGVSQPGAISVSLGNVAGGSADQVITFNVTIDPN